MNYSSKNTISQQKADGPSDFLGITQSSGLDHHAVYSRQRVDDFRENGVVSTQPISFAKRQKPMPISFDA